MASVIVFLTALAAAGYLLWQITNKHPQDRNHHQENNHGR